MQAVRHAASIEDCARSFRLYSIVAIFFLHMTNGNVNSKKKLTGMFSDKSCRHGTESSTSFVRYASVAYLEVSSSSVSR